MSGKKQINPILIGLVIVLFAVIVVLFCFVIRRTPDSNPSLPGTENKGSEITIEPNDTEPAPPEGTAEGTEVLAIFGGDSRSGKLGKESHSDSIMIVFINHDEGFVKVASVMRDCMVYIEGRGYEKINHAHYYGGPELAVRALNENFDLNIEKYVTINFNNVVKMVDMIDGVEIELSEKELAVVSVDESQKTDSGKYLLTGVQALTFSRIRKIDNDYKRTERQREVLFEIFEKSKTLSYGDRLDIFDEMIGDVNTNYKEEDLLVLMYYLSKYEVQEMAAYPQVFFGGTVEGNWVAVPCSLVDMSVTLHQFLFGETGYMPSEKVQEHSNIMGQKVEGPNYDLRKN